MEATAAGNGEIRRTRTRSTMTYVGTGMALLSLVIVTAVVTAFAANRARTGIFGELLVIGPEVTGYRRLTDGTEISVDELDRKGRRVHLRDGGVTGELEDVLPVGFQFASMGVRYADVCHTGRLVRPRATAIGGYLLVTGW